MSLDSIDWFPADLYADVRDTIDIHYHPHPDFCQRLETDIQLARKAKAVGMQAIVLKCHTTASADRAYAAREAVPGMAVFGGIVLNWPVGGLNVEAVEYCLRQGGRFVWGPTMWAQTHVDYVRKLPMDGYRALSMRFPEVGVRVLDEKGQLKREMMDICRLVAKYDACLATGHFDWDERRAVLEHALEAGIKKIVITHPNYQVTPVSVEEQKEWAARGCFIEYVYSVMTPNWQPLDPEKAWTPRRIANAIREVGAEQCIISTDLGQVHNPPQVEGMRQMIQMMREWGLNDLEIDLIARKNPARVLGL